MDQDWICYQVHFTGYVQGVGFRNLARRIAERYTLIGWVRNLSNGQVELQVQGFRSQCDEFLFHLQRAMSDNITEMSKTQADLMEGLTGFEIRYDGP